MSDTKAAVEQFAALFTAVQRLAEVEDVDKAAAAARTSLAKAQAELDQYLAHRERQAREQSKEGEAALNRKLQAADAEIRAARELHDKHVADETRKLHLARERVTTAQDVWQRGQDERTAAVARLDEQLAAKQAELNDQRQALTALREETAAEERKLLDLQRALARLRSTLAA
jgi:hypothetical protein